MIARICVPWEDFDYETWVSACGAFVDAVEPRQDGRFDLISSGSFDAIATFVRDLGYGPEP